MFLFALHINIKIICTCKNVQLSYLLSLLLFYCIRPIKFLIKTWIYLFFLVLLSIRRFLKIAFTPFGIFGTKAILENVGNSILYNKWGKWPISHECEELRHKTKSNDAITRVYAHIIMIFKYHIMKKITKNIIQIMFYLTNLSEILPKFVY